MDAVERIRAVAERVTAAHGLDVFDVQPLPADHPYRQMEQVLLTPHVAGIVSLPAPARETVSV